MNELALFAGAGGGILGGMLLGWRTICAVEIAEYPRRVLLARQRDGLLPAFPIWDDVRTFDGKPWAGSVDVVSGGFPCTDISVAGKGAGIDGEASGLWVEMARIIGEVRPRFAFVENSPALTSRGLGRVLGDFSEMGFNARWGVFSAADVGARHIRERIWIVAHAVQNRRLKGLLQDDDGTQGTRGNPPKWGKDWIKPKVVSTINRTLDEGWLAQPDAARAFDDMASVVDRLAATGNGQVPAVAAMAWRILTANTRVSGGGAFPPSA